MSIYCGLKHSDTFGKVLSQSANVTASAIYNGTAPPAWWGEPSDLLVRQFAAGPRLPLEFYIEVGRYEVLLGGQCWNFLIENRRLRDVLLAKGYPVTYREFNGGHDHVCWRGSFADAVVALTGQSI
jgi:enterochelin esterase family protein